MTPAVRLVTLLVVAIVAGTGNPYLLVFAGVLTVSAWLSRGTSAFGSALGRLRRLRWLLLSITVIYLWFTPGVPIVADLGAWSPTLEGLVQGVRRVGVLCVIALAAWFVVSGTGREGMISGLIWLSIPLTRVGIPCEPFAVRLSLTLHQVLGAEKAFPARTDGDRAGFMSRSVALASARFSAAEQSVQDETTVSVQLPESAAPRLVEWLVPAGIVTGAVILLAVQTG